MNEERIESNFEQGKLNKQDLKKRIKIFIYFYDKDDLDHDYEPTNAAQTGLISESGAK